MRLLQPEVFQGVNKKKNYFEGWYYKLISRDKKHAIAFSPGISFDKEGKGHAFVQFFDAVTGQTGYFRFSVPEFHAGQDRLDVRIGQNRFGKNGIKVDLIAPDLTVRGRLFFSERIDYPSTWLEPGIMGPFSYVPFMECYHGIVTIHQKIRGYLTVNGERIDFHDGYGYVEKDWGKAFPKAWVWTQSNHFGDADVSFMFSIATVPFVMTEFTGFLCFFRSGDQFIRFATYSGAKIGRFRRQDDHLDVVIRDRKYELRFRAVDHRRGRLLAPANGEMDRTIEESITAKIFLKLYDRKGNLLFQGIGRNAGLEMVGRLNLIHAQKESGKYLCSKQEI